jgi:hypothetical protein
VKFNGKSEKGEKREIKRLLDYLDSEKKNEGFENKILDKLYSNFSHFLQKIFSKDDFEMLFENVFDIDEEIVKCEEMTCINNKGEFVQDNERLFSSTVVLTTKGKILIIPNDFNPYYFLDDNGSTKSNIKLENFTDFQNKNSKYLINSLSTTASKKKTVSFENKHLEDTSRNELFSIGEEIPDSRSLKIYMIDTRISNPVELFCLKDIFVSDHQSLYKISLDNFNQFFLKNICHVQNYFYLIHCNPLTFEKLISQRSSLSRKGSLSKQTSISRKGSMTKEKGAKPNEELYMSFSEQSLKKILQDESWMFLQLKTFSSKYTKSLLLHEPVIFMHSIRLHKPHDTFKDSACYYFLNSLKLVECKNLSFKLVYMDKLLILLDNLSYGQQLLDVFFDSQLNLLFLVLSGGQSKCFRFEIQNIHQILFSEVDYLTSFASKEDTHLALLNSIQVNVHFLHSTDFSTNTAFPLDGARRNYLQGYNLYNNFDFLKTNSIVSSSDFNDYLMFHSMFFYNNYSSSFVDFDGLQKNSKYLLKDYFNVFKSKSATFLKNK